MVAPSMRVEISETITATYSQAGARRVIKAANEGAAVLWRDKMLMKHFRPGAAAKYNYARRKASTIARKRRQAEQGLVKYSGNRPLVDRGVLEGAMRRLHVIKANWRGATVTLVGPRYFQLRQQLGRPNLGAEVTRVTADEERQINKTSEQAADAEVERKKPRRRKVI